MGNAVFISKHSSEIVEFQQFADSHNISVTAHSFLHFEPIAFVIPERYDVLFFGSPRAVMFFQSRYSIPKDIPIASVGVKTSALLTSLGYSVEFNGEGLGSITKVAESFQEWLGDRKVLLPVSTKSLGTISKGLPTKQVVHVECYETKVVGKKLERSFDTYVFTSPSNVEGFFEANALPDKASVIAWGTSTQKALKEHTSAPVYTLSEPTFEQLINQLS